MITASPDPNPGLSVWHIRLTVALLLAALLAVLWATGHGPLGTPGCCGSAPTTTASAPPVVAPPLTAEAPAPTAADETAPPYTLTNPNGQVMSAPSTLAPWTGPSQQVIEHDVQFPAPRAAEPPAEAPVETVVAEPTPQPPVAEAAVPAPETPSEPSYTLTDPNAQVRTDAVQLPAWTGPTPEVLEHFVYYPPATAPKAADDTGAADVPPAARIYFATSKWDLPADAAETLAPIIAYLQAHPSSAAVIQGYHDPRGDPEQNAMLAKNRAGALWDVLTGAGIARDRVILQKPLNTTGSGSLSEARRAEVSIRP